LDQSSGQLYEDINDHPFPESLLRLRQQEYTALLKIAEEKRLTALKRMRAQAEDRKRRKAAKRQRYLNRKARIAVGNRKAH
jgi:hypothetical protein